MLKRLHISNYALIDVLDLEIPEHLVIITGDSGAGKSIMLGALSLLLGGRWDGTAIRDDSRNCVIEAEFSDHILRRVITPAGRSRAFIDDEPATLEAVRALAADEIDIHSQNGQQLLSSEDFRLDVVDSYAGNAALVGEYRKAYDAHAEISRQLEEVRRMRDRGDKERDYIQFRYESIAAAGIKAGELEEAEALQKSLANAEQIKQTLQSACDAICCGENSVEQQLRDSVRGLEKIGGFLPDAGALSQRIESCRIELKDLCDTMEQLQEGIDANAENLERVESRISQIYDLLRRNDAADEADLLRKQEEYAAALAQTDSLQSRESELSRSEREADEACEALCKKLSEARANAAGPLSEYLQSSIRELDMPKAQFSVEISRTPERGRSGRDKAGFLFCSTASGRKAEAWRNASGGEMSRIMLCIKSLLARHKSLPTIIFDEIDTGMSGSLADKVGRKIVEISKNIQTIAITHLPQVAAKGGAHFLVYKEYLPDGGALSRIRPLQGEERAAEIARMISGSNISAEALAAAQVLLNESE